LSRIIAMSVVRVEQKTTTIPLGVSLAEEPGLISVLDGVPPRNVVLKGAAVTGNPNPRPAAT